MVCRLRTISHSERKFSCRAYTNRHEQPLDARIGVSLPQVNTVTVKPGRRAIGFLIEPNSSPLLHCGLEVLPGDIIVNGFEVTHQRSDANFHYGTMSLPLDDLDAAAEAIIGREFPKTLHKRIIRAVVTTPSSRGLRNSWRQIPTDRFISPKFAQRSASRSEHFAPPARSI